MLQPRCEKKYFVAAELKKIDFVALMSLTDFGGRKNETSSEYWQNNKIRTLQLKKNDSSYNVFGTLIFYLFRFHQFAGHIFATVTD